MRRSQFVVATLSLAFAASFVTCSSSGDHHDDEDYEDEYYHEGSGSNLDEFKLIIEETDKKVTEGEDIDMRCGVNKIYKECNFINHGKTCGFQVTMMNNGRFIKQSDCSDFNDDRVKADENQDFYRCSIKLSPVNLQVAGKWSCEIVRFGSEENKVTGEFNIEVIPALNTNIVSADEGDVTIDDDIELVTEPVTELVTEYVTEPEKTEPKTETTNATIILEENVKNPANLKNAKWMLPVVITVSVVCGILLAVTITLFIKQQNKYQEFQAQMLHLFLDYLQFLRG
jgi:hypothetical protein